MRQFGSDEKAEPVKADRYFDEEWLKPEPRLAATPGMHRFVWNLRRERPRAIEYQYSMRAVFGEDTPTDVEGAFVLPGHYTVVLRAARGVYRAPLTVRLDPRVHTSEADLARLDRFKRELDGDLAIAAAADAQRDGAIASLDGELRAAGLPLIGAASVRTPAARSESAERADTAEGADAAKRADAAVGNPGQSKP